MKLMKKTHSTLVFLRKSSLIEKMIFSLADKLFERMKETIFADEKIENDVNVRIVVKDLSVDTINKIFNVIREVEMEFGEPGAIIPEISNED